MSDQRLLSHAVILSMEVCSRDESEYRIFLEGQVKYLTIAPGTYDRQTLSMPLGSLMGLLKEGKWNVAHISRDQATSELKTALRSVELSGVQDIWHPASVNCLELVRTRQLTAATFEASYPTQHLLASSTSGGRVIAKIARFEWEIPRIEQETRVYRILENTGIAPRFLGHIHEHGRIMGFVLERVEGRPATIRDLSKCRFVLRHFHDHGLLHGDINKYNFIVQNNTVRLIDFERSQICPGDGRSMQVEMMSLYDQLMEETGRGGGFMFVEETTEKS